MPNEIHPAIAAWVKIPHNLRIGLRAYIEDGRPTGDFLRCVLSNDLGEACARADAPSTESLFALVRYLQYHAPAKCYGSSEAYEAWLKNPEPFESDPTPPVDPFTAEDRIAATSEDDVYVCQDCKREWKEDDLEPFEVSSARLSPGDVVPYGSCPECGAACQEK